jgi:hypothetical protein
MLSTSRSRVRALAIVGMAGVVAAIGAVTFQASAAEVAPKAPAAVGPDARAVSIPGIPEAIKPPAGSKPIGAFIVASGTQNYTCTAAGAYNPTSTPEAQLIGTGGKIHHFAGPSWQSLRDNSLVTGFKIAGADKAGTIPELLLGVKSHSGSGILDKADYINRLYTSGGVAPATSCTAGQVVKVSYKAVYVFWDAP